MSFAQGNNTPTRPRIEPGSPDPESDALTIRPVRSPFLRCNLAFAHRRTKEVAYKTLVRSKLEYAAPIWHPYHESQIGQVEKVLRKATRWTCRRWRNTSSVGDMLDELEWPSLETRREQSSLRFLCNIWQFLAHFDMHFTPYHSQIQTCFSLVPFSFD